MSLSPTDTQTCRIQFLRLQGGERPPKSDSEAISWWASRLLVLLPLLAFSATLHTYAQVMLLLAGLVTGPQRVMQKPSAGGRRGCSSAASVSIRCHSSYLSFVMLLLAELVTGPQ
jgi:hypothetical protein